MDRSENILKDIRPILIIGRFLGIVSIQGVFRNKDVKKLSFKVFSFASIYPLFNLIYSVIVSIFEFNSASSRQENKNSKGSPYRTLSNFSDFNQFNVNTFIYFYCWKNSSSFISLLQKWAKCTLGLFYKNDPKASQVQSSLKFNLLMTGLILSTSVAENALYDLSSWALFRKINAQKLLFSRNVIRDFYINICHSIPTSYGEKCTPFLGFTFFICTKISNYGWNLADILSISITNALASQFKNLATNTLKKLEKNMDNEWDQVNWDEVRHDFVSLTNLLESVSDFISPLIFTCYCSNLSYLILNICRALSPAEELSDEAKMYVSVSGVQFIIRICLVTYFAAKINTEITAFKKVLEKCPKHQFSNSVMRLETALNSEPIGINVFGFFTITQKFYVSILNFIFTIELVLLQTHSS